MLFRSVVVTAGGQSSPQEIVTVEPATPGIFSLTGDGKGAGAITHLNGSPVTAQNPAARGETLVLYATGLGATNPAIGTGVIPTTLTQTAVAATVTVGGSSAEIVFSGLSGCCAGLNQVNFKIPAGAPVGGTVQIGRAHV